MVWPLKQGLSQVLSMPTYASGWTSASTSLVGQRLDFRRILLKPLFSDWKKNGFWLSIGQQYYPQLYCEAHQSLPGLCLFVCPRWSMRPMWWYFQDTLQLKNPRCKVDGSAPGTKETNHIFFGLDKLQLEVEAVFQGSRVVGNWPNDGKAIISALVLSSIFIFLRIHGRCYCIKTAMCPDILAIMALACYISCIKTMVSGSLS